MTWQQEVSSRYGSIAAGLLIGTAARYGLALGEGKRITRWTLLADFLQLFILGLAGVVLSDRLGLTGDLKAFMAALSAMSSERLIKLMRNRFFQAAEGQMSSLLPQPNHEAITRVPAGSGQPDAIGVQLPPQSPETRVGASLKRSYGRSGDRPVPDDQIEALRRLND